MKVAIIGMGVVGQAQARMFGEHVHITYDPKMDDEYPEDAIRACDFAVICVPTPNMPNGHCDLIHLWTAVAALPHGIPVLLRSTVPPGTTEKIEENSLHPVVYCPEFIQENPERAIWLDPQDVPFLILGGPEDVCDAMDMWLSEVYKTSEGRRIYHTSSRAAEMAKYVINAHLAMKVTFANEMSRVAATFGVEWRDVERLWRADPRTGFSHTSVLPGEDGKFGFAGACFPKDLQAIISAAEYGEYDAGFLKSVQDANERFRA